MAIEYVVCTDTPVVDAGFYRCHADIDTGTIADLTQAEVDSLSSAVLGMFCLAFAFRTLRKFLWTKISRADG